jgi:hypothetical protein
LQKEFIIYNIAKIKNPIMNKSVINLFKEAIKNKQALSNLSVENGLTRNFLNDFHRHIDNKLKRGSVTKKEHETIKDLFKKHQQVMNKTKGSNIVEKDELEEVKAIYYDKSLSWDERMNKLKDSFGKSERTIRRWLVNLGLKEKVVEESEQWKLAQSKEHNKKKKRFIISWAQNNTEVKKNFLEGMKAYSKILNADIHIIAGRYRNPTSLDTSTQDDEFWDERITKYLDANRHDIHKYVSILSDIKIQPTAIAPMTGLQSMTGINSCVVGHPRVQMQVLPALPGHKPKLMLSSGACTEPNYTDSKAGKMAEFHHQFGFVIIEIKDENTFFARQVVADNNGDFSDLFYNIKKAKVTKITKSAGIIFGDVHYGEHDEQAISASLDMVKKLNPSTIVLHDILSSKSISHHDLKNPFKLYEKEMNGTNSLKKELEDMSDWVTDLQKKNPKREIVVVKSNHDEHTLRYLKEMDWRKDIKNAAEYLKYAQIVLSGQAPKGIVPYVINQKAPKVKCLDRDELYMIKDYIVNNHGDKASNGSRGSLAAFAKLNFKCIVGHYHSPSRIAGALAVGTLTKLRLDYNEGPSSWLQSNVIIHENGKAQHLNIIDGEYTTLK